MIPFSQSETGFDPLLSGLFTSAVAGPFHLSIRIPHEYNIPTTLGLKQDKQEKSGHTKSVRTEKRPYNLALMMIPFYEHLTFSFHQTAPVNGAEEGDPEANLPWYCGGWGDR